MATTLLPFLYQTRTLQRLSRVGAATPAFRTLLHSTSRGTVRRNPRHRMEPRTDDIPFELPDGYQQSDEQDGPYIEQDPETGMRSTITPSERDAFSRIFEEIAARNNARPLSAVPSAPSPTDGPMPASPFELGSAMPHAPTPKITDFDNFGVRTEEPSPSSIRSTINIIVQDAAEVHTNRRRQMHKPFDALHPLEQVSASSEWEKALMRFPPSLRQAAQMALGVMEEDRDADRAAPQLAIPEEQMTDERRLSTQIDMVLDPLSKSVQNEALRRDERTRVEAKMREAVSDFALWDVLEEEVFPMIAKLGLEDDLEASTATAKRKRSKKQRDTKFPMHIYGPLYPTHLLTALRLLDTKFARSSPLALQILPRVKELGLASYVLGVSTPFYNELARIQWQRYGDPTATFNVLEEMRVAGLYCDENTRGVVQGVEAFLGKVVQGRWGPFLRELAMLPEYELKVLPRVRHWLTTINMHIYERKNEMHG